MPDTADGCHENIDPSRFPAQAVAYRRPSMSEIVNDAIREALREDQKDLAAFAERVGAGFGGGAGRTIALSLVSTAGIMNHALRAPRGAVDPPPLRATYSE